MLNFFGKIWRGNLKILLLGGWGKKAETRFNKFGEIWGRVDGLFFKKRPRANFGGPKRGAPKKGVWADGGYKKARGHHWGKKHSGEIIKGGARRATVK